MKYDFRDILRVQISAFSAISQVVVRSVVIVLHKKIQRDTRLLRMPKSIDNIFINVKTSLWFNCGYKAFFSYKLRKL